MWSIGEAERERRLSRIHICVAALCRRAEGEGCVWRAWVFATSVGLFETLSAYNPNTVLIPNGANYELFSRAMDPATAADERVAALPRPVFGFVGAIQECTDLKLIEQIAALYPQGSVVFVGDPLPGVDVSALAARPNVHLLGRVPQTELPALIKGFDVCRACRR